jgi:glucan biosynthesis protein C
MKPYTSNPSTDRLHALDAVRAFALLLGVFLHATISFLPATIDAGVWPIVEKVPSPALNDLFFLIHIFRMPVFFLIAGFFGRVMLQRHGLGGFIRDRSKRILLPLIGGFLICAALIMAVVVWAIMKTHGGVLPPGTAAGSTGGEPTLMHLWFLYVLAWLYVLVIAASLITGALGVREALARALDACLRLFTRSRVGAMVLALPIAAIFLSMPEWRWLEGVHVADKLVPLPSTYAIYGLLFVAGWILGRQRSLFDALRARLVTNLALGVVAAGICLRFVGLDPDGTTPPGLAITVVYAMSYATAMVALSFGLIGVGVKFFSAPRPAIRYVADASYWIYLMHLPVVFAWQTAFMGTNLPVAVKYLLIVALTIIPLLVTYRYLVRPTWIGALLNGRRYPRAEVHTRSRLDSATRTSIS